MPTEQDPTIAALLRARGGSPIPAAVRLPPLKSGPGWMVCIADEAAGGRALCCLTCGSVSFNPNDVENRYCGRCHKFIADQRPAREAS